MLRAFPLLLLVSLLLPSLANKVQQVHLSYHGEPTEMVVTWLTQHHLDDTIRPLVIYGKDPTKLTQTAPAITTPWTDEGSEHKVRYTYRAHMELLEPGQRYYYSVGSSDQMSPTFTFLAIHPQKEIRAAVFGDFDLKHGYALSTLTNSTENDEFDIVFHIGDISYDLNDKQGDKGDDFMNAVQPIASRVPYMVIAGNHEVSANFNHFKNRFTMPPNGMLNDNQFWSIDVGNTHFIGISSEYYMFNMSTEAQLQYEWLLADLKKNKNKWTIIFMHRPMYCCTTEPEGCVWDENLKTRNGAPGYPALEPLFNSGGVDMVFWGHRHTYERDWPVYDNVVYKRKNSQAYHNAQTPVYTVTGAAGCHDHIMPAETIPQPFTAARLPNYGYSYLNILNNTTVRTKFVDAKTNENLDPFQLTKDEGWKPFLLKKNSNNLLRS